MAGKKKRRNLSQIESSLKPVLNRSDEGGPGDVALGSIVEKLGILNGYRHFAQKHFTEFEFEKDFSFVRIHGHFFRLIENQRRIIKYLFDQHLMQFGNVHGVPLSLLMEKTGIKRAKNCKMQNFFRVRTDGPSYDLLIEETFRGCWRLRLNQTVCHPTLKG